MGMPIYPINPTDQSTLLPAVSMGKIAPAEDRIKISSVNNRTKTDRGTIVVWSSNIDVVIDFLV